MHGDKLDVITIWFYLFWRQRQNSKFAGKEQYQIFNIRHWTQIAEIVDRDYTGENVPVSENAGLLYYTSTFKHIYGELKIICMHYLSQLVCVMATSFFISKNQIHVWLHFCILILIFGFIQILIKM